MTGLRIYLDLVMGLNGLIDFCLLMGTNTLSGFPTGWKRNLPAAALGGVYSGICLVPGFAFLAGIFWRMVFLGLMSLVAFGWNRGSLKRTGTFLLLSIAMGGAALGFGHGRWESLILSGLVLWLLCRVAFGSGTAGKEFVPLQIRWQGRQIRVLALQDTGNNLRDPVTGESVLILGYDAAARLTGLSRAQMAAPLDTISAGILPGLRLIPYRAVGRSNGMLLGMRFEDVTIGDRSRGMLVAFDPGGLGKEQMYQALTGGA